MTEPPVSYEAANNSEKARTPVNSSTSKNKEYGLTFGVCIALGVAFGAIIGNLAIGIALGVAIGSSLSAGVIRRK